MPIYEYRCRDCRKRTSVFVRSMSATVRPRCEHCGGTDLSRLISRVAVARSSSSSGDFDESMFAGVDESDPRSVARFARKMRDEMGEDMGPEFDQAIEEMEEGRFPEEDAGDGGWPDDE
jgi:putative FmdB family regulatory protein